MLTSLLLRSWCASGRSRPPILECLHEPVEARQTILISSGSGSGKTTLLTALLAFFLPGERIVLIEDTAGIQIQAPSIVRLEAKRTQPDASAVSIRDLLRMALRLRPDRIIPGEVRGPEAFDLLQGSQTPGMLGTISTIHANSKEM